MEQTEKKTKSHILEVCEYVGQNVCDPEIDTEILSDYDFDPSKSLPEPVGFVRMDYPFDQETDVDARLYYIPTAKTWGELVKAVKELCIKLYAEGRNGACHALEDYVIEPIAIRSDGTAEVMIGS